MSVILKKTSNKCKKETIIFFVAVFTPLGFVRLFGVVGGVLVKPQFLRDLNEEYYMYSFEEDTIRRRINNALSTGD